MNKVFYDTMIIGAGIAGASAAYHLKEMGQNVLVLDKKGIASGGSGAAGAFVSPKIGKGGPLQKLTNEAFDFAKEFYLQHFPKHYYQSGVVRIPKDNEDAQKFGVYGAFNENSYEKLDVKVLQDLGINVPFESFFFPEAGACDAPTMCEALLEGVDVQICTVEQLSFHDGSWVCTPRALPPSQSGRIPTQESGNESPSMYKAKNVVLATGYENNLFDMRYMGVKGTWGTRGDFRSSLALEVSMHQSMSVSANMDGIIRLGATHEKGIKEPVSCQDEQALSLKEKASSMVDTSDMELLQTFCGMRAGSKDYFPLVGKVVDTKIMFEKYPAIVRGAKPALEHLEGLYVLNGLGGRGFVFAPLMGKLLADAIVSGQEIDQRVNPDRLFLKWARKLNT
jgi:tRNA 5-methylaminomethyl-2-thiouridine biosynthesis bifunctional protein